MSFQKQLFHSLKRKQGSWMLANSPQVDQQDFVYANIIWITIFHAYVLLDLKALQTMSIFCLTYLRLVCFFLGVVMALFVPDPSEAVDNRCAKWAIVMRYVYLLNQETCVSWNQIETNTSTHSNPLIMINFQLTPFSLHSTGLYFDLQGLLMPVFCLLFAHILFWYLWNIFRSKCSCSQHLSRR